MDLQNQSEDGGGKDEAKDLIVQAADITAIQDAETYKDAARLRGQIRFWIDYHTKRMDKLIDESNLHTKHLREQKNEHVDPLQAKYDVLGSMITEYSEEQERIRVQLQLLEEAKRKREAQEEKLRRVELAEEIGDEQLIREMLDAPLNTRPVVIVSETPVVDDLSFTSHKHYEVVDLLALVKAVAAGEVPIRVLWDIAKPFRSGYLNSQAIALHDTIKPDENGIRWLYPGVKVWSSKTAVTKSS